MLYIYTYIVYNVWVDIFVSAGTLFALFVWFYPFLLVSHICFCSWITSRSLKDLAVCNALAIVSTNGWNFWCGLLVFCSSFDFIRLKHRIRYSLQLYPPPAHTHTHTSSYWMTVEGNSVIFVGVIKRARKLIYTEWRKNQKNHTILFLSLCS